MRLPFFSALCQTSPFSVNCLRHFRTILLLQLQRADYARTYVVGSRLAEAMPLALLLWVWDETLVELAYVARRVVGGSTFHHRHCFTGVAWLVPFRSVPPSLLK